MNRLIELETDDFRTEEDRAEECHEENGYQEIEIEKLWIASQWMASENEDWQTAGAALYAEVHVRQIRNQLGLGKKMPAKKARVKKKALVLCHP